MFLAETMRTLAENNMIGNYPPDNSETYVSFDFGSGKSVYTAMVFWQIVSDSEGGGDGMRLRVVDFYKAQQMDLEHYSAIMRGKGYNIVKLILPHDAEHKDSKNANNLTVARQTSIAEKLDALGWRNIQIIPKTNSKMSEVETTKNILHRTFFNRNAHTINCSKGLLDMLRGIKRRIDSNLNVMPEIVRDNIGSAATPTMPWNAARDILGNFTKARSFQAGSPTIWPTATLKSPPLFTTNLPPPIRCPLRSCGTGIHSPPPLSLLYQSA